VVADAVLALSFPLHPPGKPEKSRADEARLVTDAGRPLAVIQGEKDPFGSPDEVEKALDPAAHVFAARGTHSFTKDPFEVLDEARAWLDQLPRPRGQGSCRQEVASRWSPRECLESFPTFARVRPTEGDACARCPPCAVTRSPDHRTRLGK
jgi:hypothetical protein